MATAGSNDHSIVLTTLSAPLWMNFEPIGAKYYQHVYQLVHGLTLSRDSHADSTEESESEVSEGEEEQVDPDSLDPIQWKDQDHYVVLGLSKTRYRASPKEIRKAYQQQVLLHHPDKQASDEDTMFKCIQIAYDILSNPKKRRAFDSVDPTFNNEVPSISSSNKENFYEVFRPVFEANARWSTNPNVPLLGNAESSLEEVESFYSFWYDFNSWREFSYLDEENAEKGENREERKWIEKQNKAARQKKRKEELVRLRTLVDNAYTCDPRVKYFKDKQRQEREDQKKAKKEAARQEAMRKEQERRKREEEEKREQQRREEEQKALATRQRQEREAVKKTLKKERKQLRTLLKDNGYFTSDESARVQRMSELDFIIEEYNVEQLQGLFQRLSLSDDKGTLLEREIALWKEKTKQETAASSKVASVSSSSTVWSSNEVQHLIKAITLYPSGTQKRWDAIARHINSHMIEGDREKTAQQVIAKVKSMKKIDASDREAESKHVYKRFEQQHIQKGSVDAPPTTRDVSEVSQPWTSEEQKLLERAIRTIPSTTAQRWDRIAETVGTRTKDECITRFKELVAMVKAKKQQSEQK